MQINKSKKTSTSQSSGGLFDDDFASGFEDSKFDKFKPALKADSTRTSNHVSIERETNWYDTV